MSSPGLFDPHRAEAEKVRGMQEAAKKRKAALRLVRLALKGYAITREDRTATADDAARWMISVGLDPEVLGNAFGSLFLEQDWFFTGQWRKSERVSNHARMNRVWRLR
jgi:hypothetical protein